MLARATSLSSRARNAPAAGGLALLVIVGAAVLTAVGKLQTVPIIVPDEFLYGNVAQSIASGDGESWRGVDLGLSTVFPYLLSPAWLIASDIPVGYELAKFLTALFFALTVIPLWLALRKPVGGWIALIPCALLLAGPWAVDSSKLLTEVVALPIVTASIALLWCGLRIERGGRKYLVAAIAMAGLAVLVRLHLAVLMPAFGAAILVDALVRTSEERRARLKAFAPELSIIAAAALIGAVMILFDVGGLGIYESVREFGIDGNAFGRAFEHVALLGIDGLLLPPLALVAMALSPLAWRDPGRRALLAVFLSMTLALVAVAGWFLSGVETTVVERYVVYLVPWLLAAPFLAREFVSAREVIIATALIAALVALPISLDATNQAQTLVAARNLFDGLFGLLGEGSRIFTVLLVAVAGAITLLFLTQTTDQDEAGRPWQQVADVVVEIRNRLRLNDLNATVVVGLILLVVAVPVTAQRWKQVDRQSSDQRAVLPGNLNWVDDAIGTDQKAAIVVIGSAPRLLAHEYTEFFNSSIQNTYRRSDSFGGIFRTCPIGIAKDGSFTTGNSCPQPPANLLLTGDMYRMSLSGQSKKIDKPGIGRLASTSQSPSSIQSIVESPCSESSGQCKGQLTIQLWTKRASTLGVAFAGGGESGNSVLINDRFYDIPVTGTMKFKLRVDRGASKLKAQLSWITTLGAPTLESVTLDGTEIYAGPLVAKKRH